MIEKMFGATEEEQYAYLKPKLTALAVSLVLPLVGGLLYVIGLQTIGAVLAGIGQLVLVIELLVFGWAIMRALFGYATVGILFSNNIVLGSVIFVLYIMVGYFGGIVVAVIGLCRFLKLLKIRKQAGA